MSNEGRRDDDNDNSEDNRSRSRDENKGSLAGFVVGALIGAVVMGLYTYFTSGSNPPQSDSAGTATASPSASRTYKMPTLATRRATAQHASPPSPASPPANNNNNASCGDGGSVDASPATPWDTTDSTVAESPPVRCIVCTDKPAIMLFTECGHLCCCEDCIGYMATAAGVHEGEDVVLPCPQCRTRGTLQRVYLP